MHGYRRGDFVDVRLPIEHFMGTVLPSDAVLDTEMNLLQQQQYVWLRGVLATSPDPHGFYLVHLLFMERAWTRVRCKEQQMRAVRLWR